MHAYVWGLIMKSRKPCQNLYECIYVCICACIHTYIHERHASTHAYIHTRNTCACTRIFGLITNSCKQCQHLYECTDACMHASTKDMNTSPKNMRLHACVDGYMHTLCMYTYIHIRHKWLAECRAVSACCIHTFCSIWASTDAHICTRNTNSLMVQCVCMYAYKTRVHAFATANWPCGI